MKKLVLVLSLLIGAHLSQAQFRNKVYPLYYTNDKFTQVFPTGLYFRNDTLFIDLSALANVLAIQNEGDSVRRIINLVTYREKTSVLMNKMDTPKTKNITISPVKLTKNKN